MNAEPSRTLLEQQAELATVLARVQELEQRLLSLEAQRTRGPLQKLGGALGSHVRTTAGRISGKRPLPGLRLLRGLTPEEVFPEDYQAESSGGVIVRSNVPDDVPALQRLPERLPGLRANLTIANLSILSIPSAQQAQLAVGRSAKGAVDRAMTTAANITGSLTSPVVRGVQNVTSRAYRAGGAALGVVDDLVLEYVPSTTLPQPTAASSAAIAAILNAGAEQQLYDSRRVVLACISIGALLGLLAGRLTRSSLLYSSLLYSFFGAYAATLSNPLGRTVRLVGVVCVALLSSLIRLARDQYRSATFVYQTGRWFERIDTRLQKFDRNLGSPSRKWDSITGFLASELTRSANVTNRTHHAATRHTPLLDAEPPNRSPCASSWCVALASCARPPSHTPARGQQRRSSRTCSPFSSPSAAGSPTPRPPWSTGRAARPRASTRP